MPFGVIWSGLEEDGVSKFITNSTSLWEDKIDNVPRYILGGTIGTHIGPEAIGLTFFEK